MSTVYKIPLQIGRPQSVIVIFGTTPYKLTFKYFDAVEGGWHLDIDESETAVNLVSGIPLVTGTDLLGQFEYLGIPGALAVYTDSDASESVPTFDNLGANSNLYFVVQ